MNNPPDTIKLVEYQSCLLKESDLTEGDATRIYHNYKNQIDIQWPSPKTSNQWQLTSWGWVGFIPLEAGRGISLHPKIPLRNLFEMLEYAYDLESFKMLEGVYDAETIEDLYEHLASILSERVFKRVREGLYKTYREEHEACSFIKGKIDLPAMCGTAVKTNLLCYSEDHTMDIEDNQIIAWTLFIILQSGLLRKEKVVNLVGKVERVLRNSIQIKTFNHLACVGRSYNRLNSDYEILHKLCRFFLENVGPTQNLGDRSMVPFLVDMARLFELFVARWLEGRLNEIYQLKKQENLMIGEKGAIRMVMDMVICQRDTGRPLCVLDTKYKAHNKVLNEDYYQVLAYSDAMGCENAILIYPKELEYPFDEKPGKVRVRTAIFALGTDLETAGSVFLKDIYSVLETVQE